MIALRLFSAADASRQIDVRVVDEREELTIGRDAAAGWPLADPDRALSRLHLKVALRDGVTRVTDTSTNGVTLAGRDERLPRDQPVTVDLGERLEVGPYVILVERADPMTAPRSAPARNTASPFDSGDEAPEPSAKRRADPFASALPRDPLGDAPIGSLGRSGDSALADGDAWDRKGERQAGDWDGPAKVRNPGALIGAPLAWRDPAAAEVDERGFGFDVPFSRPMLRTPDIAASDLAIPSDWDAASASPAAREAQKTPDAGADKAQTVPPRPVSPPQSPKTEDPTPQVASRPHSPRFVAPAVPTPDGVQSRACPDEDADRDGEPASEGALEAEPTPMPRPATDSPPAVPGLLEAFCAGARLDPASFALEDQAKLMERVGAVYRHMVLGLSDVMSERTALKSEYRMVRTTIQADANNPLKWAPPQKVAAELLRGSNDGFLAGPDAVTESFQDIKKHLLCMLAGLRAALSSTLDSLAPGKIEESIKDQSFVLKPRGAVAWAEYARVYAQLRKDAEDNPDSPVNREFRAAYEKQLTELDRMALR